MNIVRIGLAWVLSFFLINESMASSDPVAWSISPAMGIATTSLGKTSSVTYTFTNRVPSVAIPSIAYDYSPGVFEISDNCSNLPLVPYTSCTVTIKFIPQQVGLSRIQLVYGDVRNHNRVPLPILWATATPIDKYTVTPMADSHVTVTSSAAQIVDYNHTLSFTVTPDTGYTLQPVGGTCPAGSWADNVYTTGQITGDCSVSFGAKINTFIVSSKNNSFVTVSPGSTIVDYNHSATFTVTPQTGYTLDKTLIGGDCPKGSWSGNVYTTGLVHAACSVSFNADLNIYNVSTKGDGNETISTGTGQPVFYNQTLSITVIANPGFTVSPTVNGDCPAGQWNGIIYTTGAITQTCSVIFSATPQTSILGGTKTALNAGKTETQSYTVSGTVIGLNNDETLILQNNDQDSLSVIGTNANPSAAFTFSPQVSGSNYDVQVVTQPANQVCMVLQGKGTRTLTGDVSLTVVCTLKLPYIESFRFSTTVFPWETPLASSANSVCLTASTQSATSRQIPGCDSNSWYKPTPDSQGFGALRLTDVIMDQERSVVFKPLLNLEQGLSIQFTAYSYGEDIAAQEANGFSFFLVDGTSANEQGELQTAALQNSFLRIGFDEHESSSATNGSTPRPNSINIQGPASLLNPPTSLSCTNPSCTSEIARGRKVYRVEIAPGQCSAEANAVTASNACLNVYVNSQLNRALALNTNANLDSIPREVFLGYAGAAGKNIQEISDLIVSKYGSLYTIQGTISGLADGETIILQNEFSTTQGSQTATIDDYLPLTTANIRNGTFTFPSALTNGTAYDVTILQQPLNQTCNIIPGTGSGAVTGANVININITCS
ncbi:hypothetical protein BN59_00571 [Legionella massiliensis]|uniref:Uncharacterized protein n=1 Tax=Legionella massiliensis TaxID=1034943 RepID=A0A078KX05_9GAMM|nr:hypothetical protein [Legionella massiliensis]CDZ76304.1 hypothetical protein BN59_00571 [Legionella massiliensis]CEE12042.1 hypothetical protein BN1094_00571 [Legionella massiliensis]